MKIRCGCGSDTFKKIVKLRAVLIIEHTIEEEIYYSCTNCKNVFAKKEINYNWASYTIIDNEAIVCRDFESY